MNDKEKFAAIIELHQLLRAARCANDTALAVDIHGTGVGTLLEVAENKAQLLMLEMEAT